LRKLDFGISINHLQQQQQYQQQQAKAYWLQAQPSVLIRVLVDAAVGLCQAAACPL
jgi:hypothetical protein